MSKDNSTSLNAEGSSYAPQQSNHFESVGMSNGDNGARITSRELNSNDTAGVIAQPSFTGGMPDNMITPSQPVTNAEAVGELNNGASEENRSAKWKHGESIGRTAGVPDKGRNQYDTPQ